MLIAETKTPPAGWNSFDCYMGSINEEQALANLELFLKKLKPAGYEYFCLDAAWYADGDQACNERLRRVGQFRNMHLDPYGRFVPSPVNFPHGLRALADRCHENGVKFGVHIMRGMPRMALERNTPIKGTNFRARDIYDPDNFCSWCGYWVATDASHPGTFAYYRSVVEYLTDDLTVDFIKRVLNKITLIGALCLGVIAIFPIIFGAASGMQGLALGGTTRKMKFGHHGCNHPVKDLATGHVEISSQNHGFCVVIDGCEHIETTHVNLNDGTLEGLYCPDRRVMSVQYHPEAAAGPHDSHYLFGRFHKMISDNLAD